MALISVDADPQPGEAGYYDWHDRVAKSHNQLKAALDAAANGDLLGADANGDIQKIDSGTYALRHVEDLSRQTGAADDWDGTRAGSTDSGPALQATIDTASANAPADGYAGALIPKAVNGWYFATGVQVPSNVVVIVEGLCINDATQPSGLDSAIASKNWLFALNDVDGVQIVGPDGGFARIKAIAEGDFTGGRNPQVAVGLAGTIDNVKLRVWATDHQNFAIQYGDTDTDPATAYYNGLTIDAIIDGDTGPAGDGSGINLFPRAESSSGVPASRNLHLGYLDIDVTRGNTDRTEHGPQCVKFSNVLGFTFGHWTLAGGSVGCAVVTNGAQQGNGGVIHTRRSGRGVLFNEGAPSVPSAAVTRDINIGCLTYDQDGVTAKSGIQDGIRLNNVGNVNIGQAILDGDIRIERQDTSRDLIENLRVANGTVLGDLIIEESAASQADDHLHLDGVGFPNAPVAPMRTSYAPRAVLWLPGTSGNYVSTPDHADLDITGDIDLRAWIHPASWRNGQALIAKRSNSGEYSWRFSVGATGVPGLWLSDDGTNETNASASTTVPDDSLSRWVQVTWRASDGQVQFFTSFDGHTWTQLGTDQTIGIAAINAGTDPVELGTIDGGTVQRLQGLYLAAQIRDGIDGTLVADYRADLPASPLRDSTGKVWTVNGADSAWQPAYA